MRELQTCDFCGTDPVGVYEPLPDSLAADQPRVALCADCRDTLRRVLAPLDGADAGEAAAASDLEPEPSPAEPDDATHDSDDAAETPEPTDRAPTPDEAVTIDASAPAEDGDSDGGGDADEDAAADGASKRDDASTTPKRRPSGYRNVLRLVRNRDEALSRDDLEALLSSAYDMSAADVRRAVDAAVENGDLRETDGGGLRPA